MNLTTTQIAARLGYKRVVSFQGAWQKLCPECRPPLPDSIPAESELKTVLKLLSQQQKGRSEAIIRGAADLLFEMELPGNSGALQAKEVAQVSEPVAHDATSYETIRHAKADAPGNSTAANLDLSVEIPKPAKVSDPKKVAAPANSTKLQKLLASLTALDAVYFIVVCAGIYSAYFFLYEIGAVLGAIYALVSYHAMRMAKSRDSQSTATAGIVAVIMLEALGSFAHFSMFNLRIFQAAKTGVLPFDAWQNPELPSIIAAVISAFVALTGVYCVWVTHAQTQEKAHAKAFEQAHGVAY